MISDAVDPVTWAPDNGWSYHSKHVEQFAGINILYIVASFWIIIDTGIFKFQRLVLLSDILLGYYITQHYMLFSDVSEESAAPVLKMT